MQAQPEKQSVVQQIRTNFNNNNLISDAIELIEEDQFDPNVSAALSDEDEQIDSSSPEKRQQSAAKE